MFIAGRHVERRVIDAVHAAGYPDLTLAMARLAARIHDEGSRLTNLAEAAGVTKQTAYILVEQLVAAGYVRRTPDPTDRRARLIRIEPRGRRVQKVARQVEAEVLQEWQAHLGARDLERLTDALTRLREITDVAR
jgi:DNA-binding MarR family transcriptional regulator